MELDGETITTLLNNVKRDADDISNLIDYCIRPMFYLEDKPDDYEISIDKYNKLIEELITLKDNFNKSFAALKRKV